MFAFFEETCGRFPDLTFLHYNLPLAKRLVTPDEYARLAERFPNLVATKYGSADYGTVIGLLTKASSLCHFLTDLAFGYGSLIGECGFLISLASINPRRARAYFDAGARRDAATLATMGAELAAMVEELKRAVGPSAHMDGAYDKIFAKMRDPRFPLRLLPPYQGASGAACDRFVAVVRERFPQWLEHR
jgi:dihydrodipicolinate synthase/N-acetylneuraminate lyase